MMSNNIWNTFCFLWGFGETPTSIQFSTLLQFVFYFRYTTADQKKALNYHNWWKQRQQTQNNSAVWWCAL